MPVPTPGPNEEKDVFESRCIRFLVNEGTEQEQAVAICLDKWRESKKASLTFEAAVHSIKSGDERNLATFYLMNTTQNRLGWSVTDKALEEALPTLLGKTIGCGPGYKTDPPHDPNPMSVGKWVSTDKPNGYALATAEITDDVVWEKMKSGKWGPISVIIRPYKKRFDNGNPIVESFTFRTVDFVDVPAFPQAGFINFAGLTGETIVNPIELCASFYESQSNGQAPGSLNPEELRKMQKKEIEQLQKKVKELEASVTTLTNDKTTLEAAKVTLEAAKVTLEGEKTTLKATVEELKNPDENPEIKKLKATVEKLKNPDENPEIKKLKDKVAAMEAEKHQKLLTACVEARFKAGLSTDKVADMKALESFTDDMLKFNTLEAGKVEEMKKASEPSGPKWKYTDKGTTDLQAAIDKQREAYFFPPRELEATE